MKRLWLLKQERVELPLNKFKLMQLISGIVNLSIRDGTQYRLGRKISWLSPLYFKSK